MIEERKEEEGKKIVYRELETDDTGLRMGIYPVLQIR
jgi:hypothetical protein